ncbi:hypothetical protein AU195_07985 [Mycobacterium sp. IS-1496]|uniref:hypothetical protein n=1 Tax=Mycobacterium sp. IS-1496 TaxID=1772284 RepID=UPI000741725D|nr:hypothetical protein [Mycobacterium sp. IS-1496]KUI33940.1 hypothetical protein AU195_07985 [Mycobacterium sp. IS-1496]
MKSIVKRASAGAVLGGGLLFSAGLGLAQAQPDTIIGDGLVNVGIGDVTILEDVNVGVAANVVAQLCDVADVNAGVLGEVTQVDTAGTQITECEIADAGGVTVTQNGPGGSEQAPGAANRPQG